MKVSILALALLAPNIEGADRVRGHVTTNESNRLLQQPKDKTKDSTSSDTEKTNTSPKDASPSSDSIPTGPSSSSNNASPSSDSATKSSGKSSSSSSSSSSVEPPPPECATPAGQLAFAYQTEALDRQCNMFSAIAASLIEEEGSNIPDTLLDMAFFSPSLRDVCPCQNQEALAVCANRYFTFLERGNDDEYDELNILPPECESTSVSLVSTPVCGSGNAGTNYEVYAQYCATEVESVRESTQDAWSNVGNLLREYRNTLQELQGTLTTDNIPQVFDEAMREARDLLAFIDALQEVPCLQGCAQFVAHSCCDDEFTVLDGCDGRGLREGVFNGGAEAIMDPLDPPFLDRTIVSAGYDNPSCADLARNPPPTFPGETQIGENIQYRVFTIDYAEDNACIRARIYQSEDCPDDSIIVAAYGPVFDPMNLESNFLGASGRITDPITDFDFVVQTEGSNGYDFNIVVTQARPFDQLCRFRFVLYSNFFTEDFQFRCGYPAP